MPVKLANFVVEYYIENINKDTLFQKRADVRKKTKELFGKALECWEGNNKNAMLQILDNKIMEAESNMSTPWFKWYSYGFENYLNNAFTDDNQKMLDFYPTKKDEGKLIFNLFRYFYTMQKDSGAKPKVTVYELALLSWDDYMWFHKWMRSNLELFPEHKTNLINSNPPGMSEDANLMNLANSLDYVDKNFLNDKSQCTEDIKKAIASRFGSMFGTWLKKSWSEFYKRQSDRPVIEAMMKSIDLVEYKQ